MNPWRAFREPDPKVLITVLHQSNKFVRVSKGNQVTCIWLCDRRRRRQLISIHQNIVYIIEFGSILMEQWWPRVKMLAIYHYSVLPNISELQIHRISKNVCNVRNRHKKFLLRHCNCYYCFRSTSFIYVQTRSTKNGGSNTPSNRTSSNGLYEKYWPRQKSLRTSGKWMIFYSDA